MTSPTKITTLTVTADVSQAVQAIRQVRDAARTLGPRRGLLTSEFWVTILSTPTLLTLLNTVFHGDFSSRVQQVALIITAALSLGYALTRAHLKRPFSVAAATYDARQLLAVAQSTAPAVEQAVATVKTPRAPSSP